MTEMLDLNNSYAMFATKVKSRSGYYTTLHVGWGHPLRLDPLQIFLGATSHFEAHYLGQLVVMMRSDGVLDTLRVDTDECKYISY
jgi:hypothetical protein